MKAGRQRRKEGEEFAAALDAAGDDMGAYLYRRYRGHAVLMLAGPEWKEWRRTYDTGPALTPAQQKRLTALRRQCLSHKYSRAKRGKIDKAASRMDAAAKVMQDENELLARRVTLLEDTTALLRHQIAVLSETAEQRAIRTETEQKLARNGIELLADSAVAQEKQTRSELTALAVRVSDLETTTVDDEFEFRQWSTAEEAAAAPAAADTVWTH